MPVSHDLPVINTCYIMMQYKEIKCFYKPAIVLFLNTARMFSFFRTVQQLHTVSDDMKKIIKCVVSFAEVWTYMWHRFW
jgi:hypothetical protein